MIILFRICQCQSRVGNIHKCVPVLVEYLILKCTETWFVIFEMNWLCCSRQARISVTHVQLHKYTMSPPRVSNQCCCTKIDKSPSEIVTLGVTIVDTVRFTSRKVILSPRESTDVAPVTNTVYQMIFPPQVSASIARMWYIWCINICI